MCVSPIKPRWFTWRVFRYAFKAFSQLRHLVLRVVAAASAAAAVAVVAAAAAAAGGEGQILEAAWARRGQCGG